MKHHESHTLRDHLLASQVGSPLGFAVGNGAAPNNGPVVYISTNASLGTLTITIQNNSGAPVSLTTSSVLSISMFPLLLPADIGRIKVGGGAPWSATPSTKSLQLSPTAPLQISSMVQIELVNVFSSQADDGSGYFVFSYSGFNGVTDSSARVNMHRLHPGTAADANVTFDFVKREAYANTGDVFFITTWTPPAGQTGVANWILPELKNNDYVNKLPLGTEPQIQISFLTGDGPGCLCTDEQLGVVISSIAQADPDSTWTITLNTEDVAPIVVLTPNKSNPYFLAPAGGSVQVQLSNLVTFQPQGTTPVFLLYSGIKGYNSGYQMKMLTLGPPTPAEVSLGATNGDGTNAPVDSSVVYKGPLTLKWNIFAAESVSVVIDGVATTFGPIDQAVVHPTQQPSIYALTPLVNGQSTGLQPSMQFNISPPTVTTSYTVSNGQATLHWTAVGADYCTLSVDGVQQSGNLPASGSQNIDPIGSHVYIVTGVQSSGPQLSASSAPLTIVGPNASISASGTYWEVFEDPASQNYWNCNMSWSTSDAVSCNVWNVNWNGWSSQALQGGWGSGDQNAGGGDYPGGLYFQITAVGANGISITRTAQVSWTNGGVQ